MASTASATVRRRLGVLIAAAMGARQGAGPGSGGRASAPGPGVVGSRGRHRPATSPMATGPPGARPRGATIPSWGRGPPLGGQPTPPAA